MIAVVNIGIHSIYRRYTPQTQPHAHQRHAQRCRHIEGEINAHKYHDQEDRHTNRKQSWPCLRVMAKASDV
ncbi:MAG: hypothetical protein GPOALKHO_001649 [Sodalis sp.]|nr:MAG: hypothetical protein GPOALKHO_001649 [Sodalis sp.]